MDATGGYGGMIGGMIQGTTGIMQGAFGGYQYLRGKQMENKLGDKPLYQVPEEVKSSLSLAQRSALMGLPAEQQQQFVENMQSMQATGLGQLSSRKGGLQGIGTQAQTATQGYRDLLSMDATARLSNQQQYMQQLDNMAGYKDLQWQENTLQPYQDKLAYARAMQGAGLQNLQGGNQTLAQSGSTFAGGGGFDKSTYGGGQELPTG